MWDFVDAYARDDIHQSYDKYFQDQNGTKYSKHLTKKMCADPLRSTSIGGDACRVCGLNQNTGRNFGVMTCSTCKAFFRRNGRNAASLPPCRFGGNCSINERNRRQCPACRLAKCFAVGMQKDLIRTDEERAARLRLVRANRLQRHEKLQQQFVQDVNEQYYHLNRTAQPVYSSYDWIQLTNIRNAYEQFCLHPILYAEEEREEYLSTLPIKCRLKENSFLNTLKTRLTSLTAFFRASIPELQTELTSNDCRWLIQTNLRYLLLFSSMDLMSIKANQIHFDENKACHHVYPHVYGQELVREGTDLIHRLHQLIGFDSIISKMMQILLFLSPCLLTNQSFSREHLGRPAVDAIVHISHFQEHYTQLFWSYLIYRHGEREAERLLMSIIGQVLQHQNYYAQVEESLCERQPFGNAIYSLLTTFSED